MRNRSLAIAASRLVPVLALTAGLFLTMAGQDQTSPDAPHINPGLAFQVVSANVASDGVISVRYRVSDSTGILLDMEGTSGSAGTIAVRHQAGYRPGRETHFLSYSTIAPPKDRRISTLSVEDSGGTLTRVGPGEYIYTFGSKAPSGWNPKATHRIVVHGLRDMKPSGLGVRYAETIYDFVPAGGKPEAPEMYRRCNSCHGASQAAPDGSSRSEQLCIMCHTQLKCAS